MIWRRPCTMRQSRLIGVAAISVAVAFLLQCSSSTGIDLDATSSAIVYGSVEDIAGMPVSGAFVVLEHRPGGCEKDRLERDEVSTSVAGEYRRVFTLGSFIRDTSCFVLVAVPPEGSGLVTSPEVPFNVEFHPGFPIDSVRVDVTLAAE